jgi:predicted nucleotidyltransferase component of viral defense system
MAAKIDLKTYVKEVREKMNLKDIRDEIISKDLLLTLILAEFQKEDGIFKELILKGGTLLARNFLKYHRFSEDLDFVHKNSEEFRELKRNKREKRIKDFIDIFTPKLKKVADALDLNFSENRSDLKYCSILHGRTVYIFRIFYESDRYIKIEINFIEKLINAPKEVSIKAITDFFDSRELMFVLGLSVSNFKALSYPIEEIILEKFRAILTRDSLKERDIFDLYLIKDSLKFDVKEAVKKIEYSSLIKRGLKDIISKKLKELENDVFFKSDEQISELAIVKYDSKEFENFKEKIKPILINICKEFLLLNV